MSLFNPDTHEPASRPGETPQAGPDAGGARTVRVWDIPVRLFHWLLVALLGVCWYTGEVSGIDEMTWHMRCGYAVLGLVLFRVMWGLVGSTTARFSHFLRGPREGIAYAAGLVRRKPAHYLGHTPLGGWMIALLLVSLLVQTVTGLFANDDVMTEGPLMGLVAKSTSDWLTTIHKWNFELLLVLAGAHVAAVLLHLVVLRENLIVPMLSGRKRLAADRPDPAFHFAGSGISLVVAAIAAGAVYWLVS
jgi:cytochrome b